MTDDGQPTPYAGYETWKQWNRLFEPSADDIAVYQRELSGCRLAGGEVLEIGFGAGGFLAWAQSQGANVAGVEIIEPLVAAARERGIPLLPPAFEEVAAAHAGRFDTIVALDVFEHFTLAQIATRLNAAETMLAPGGHLVLRFPNAQSPFGLAPQHGDPTHLSALSSGVFEQLIQGTGFAVVRYGDAARPPGQGLHRLIRLARASVRGLVGAILGFAYGQSIPWDPVVTLVLRKSPS
jgi:hypothetical protein